MGKKKRKAARNKSKVFGDGKLADIDAAISLVKKSRKIRSGGLLERYW